MSHATTAGNGSKATRARLMTLLVRPTAAPLGLGVAVAASFIVAETVLVRLLSQIGPDNTFGAIFLLGVLVVSARWGFELSVTTTLASALAYVYVHFGVEGNVSPVRVEDWVAILVFLTVALLANVLAGQARLRTAEALQRRRETEMHRDRLAVLADQQTALRRVATLVARGAAPSEVFSAVAKELAWCLDVDHSTLLRYETDPATTVLAAGGVDPEWLKMPMGARLSVEGENIAAMVRRTGGAARLDSYDDAAGPAATHIRELGIQSAVGTPIIVEGRVWGVAVVGSAQHEPLPLDTEARMADFTDLVGTAIANAEARAELTASRARIVAAADVARRRFERDLHDGAQQRLVSLGLELRGAEASVPPEMHPLREQLSQIMGGLAGVFEDLQQISRGIHPAILSRGGLGPALKTVARRSAIPVQLRVCLERRLPDSIEVGAYYVVAEALTNAAKHARASHVTVSVRADGDHLHLWIRDDGVGGADARKGSGLTGLADRVAALGGTMVVSSQPGNGTSLRAEIPLENVA